MSKQGKDGALSALQELLQRIAADHPNVKIVDMTCGEAGVGRKAQHHPLQEVFNRCIDQAVLGKGEERHGKGLEFFEQPWVDIARTHGIGFLTGQAEKKLREAQGMDADGWEREMLGAINYAAMAMLYRFVVVPSDDVLQCPKCYLCHEPAPVCPSCGHPTLTSRPSAAAAGGTNEG